MAFVATNAAQAINYLESFKDNNGITYRVYEYDINSLYQYAVITNIQSGAYTLNIPGKVTRPNGREAIVHGFDEQFTCDCPNAAALVIAQSTEAGYVAGNFTGMPNLNNIWFYSSTTSPAIGRSWNLDSSTRFAKPISVYLSELVSPATYSFITYYFNYNSLVSKWKSHSQVNSVCCTHQYSYGNIGFTPFAGNTSTTVEAAVTYIGQNANEIYVPAYSNSMKITRLGYPDAKINISYMSATSIEFEGDIFIGEDVDFKYFNQLKKMVFKGNANILHTDFSTYCPIEQIEFYGDAEYGSFSNLRQLKSVYFYGMPPSSYRGSYYNINNVTFYFNMDIYEIEEWKANNPVWADANIQPIDPRSSYRKVPSAMRAKARSRCASKPTAMSPGPSSTPTLHAPSMWTRAPNSGSKTSALMRRPCIGSTASCSTTHILWMKTKWAFPTKSQRRPTRSWQNTTVCPIPKARSSTSTCQRLATAAWTSIITMKTNGPSSTKTPARCRTSSEWSTMVTSATTWPPITKIRI